MITARPQKNAFTAKQYYTEHLGKSDYYSEGQQTVVRMFGKGCERLGLVPGASLPQEAFERLCDNLHPITGEKLTVRQRMKDRRVCFDFTVSAPKSVSILAITLGDQRLIAAHEAAAQIAMTRLEAEAGARVRKGRQDSERRTGEVVGATVTHGTSRALDPQLHTHYVLFNATWDSSEGRWKALQTTAMFEKMGFFTEVYRNELATRVKALGYGIRTAKHGFEIEGVSPELLERFSKRRQAILSAEAKVSEKVGQPLSNNARAVLAQSTRDWKDLEKNPAEAIAYQRSQLSGSELATLEALVKGTPRGAGPPPVTPVSPEAAITHARDHLFERRSVVPVHAMLREALAYGRGGVTLESLEEHLLQCPDLIESEDRVTTVDMLQRERELIRLVNAGMGRLAPLNAKAQPAGTLSAEQRAAFSGVMRSPDLVTILRGAAGAGKSEVIHSLHAAIRETGVTVVVLAPSRAACEALNERGELGATTTQGFLAFAEHTRVRGGVLLIDEAGLLSLNDMVGLVAIAQRQGARVVLCGDTRQHAGIEAGDALRLLESRSAIRPIELNRVQRQTSVQYREAIESFAAGRGEEALDRLDAIGALHETDDDNRYGELATRYLDSMTRDKSALIVSPTWDEIDAISDEVRHRLKEAGRLGREERRIEVHEPLKWTRAQKCDWKAYRPGLILNFHRATSVLPRGAALTVLRVEGESVIAANARGEEVRITRKQVACFDVSVVRALPVAEGETLLLRANRLEARLVNGGIVTVQRIREDGAIELKDGRVIPSDFRSFTYGYCVTSHAAQGRTVDHVYVAMGAESMTAANRNQFYVSTSRGRERVEVFTHDVEELRSAVRRSGAREGAMEFVDSMRLLPEESVRLGRGRRI